MRRLVFSVIVASGLVVIGAGSASAEPTPAAGTANAVPGKKVCKIEDAKLDELSGLVATKSGFIVVNDSTVLSSHKRVFYLDDNCRITKSVRFSGNGPRDTEDMALSPDGKTLWIGDIGDNDRTRTTIGLWKMDVSGTREPTLYRMTYPPGDGPYDAEGLMINGDGTPIVLTKEPNRVSMFVPSGPLKAESLTGVPMRRAGEIKLPSSTTDNPLGPLGRFVATGAAVSPDRSKVAIRTYADAFQWPVSNGDLLAAVKGTPTQTPLPDEPQGEAITYSSDGAYFFTVSDMQGKTQDAANYVLRYAPAAKPVVTRTTAGGTGAGSGKSPSWFSSLSLDDITYLVGGVGVLGAILVGLGIFGIVRARKHPPLDPAGRDDDPDGPKPGDAETELLAVGGPQRPVYARGGRQGRGGPPPNVYGGRSGGPGPAGGPQRGSGVYGGEPAGGRPAPSGRSGSGDARPVPGGGRPAQGGGRPVSGDARPVAGGGRPASGGNRPVQSGGQPMGRPVPGAGGQGGGQQPGRPGRGGAYGVPPAPPPAGRNGPNGSGQRPSGSYGQADGRPDTGGRQAAQGGGYVDVNGVRGRDYDNPGYGRGPYAR